MGEEKLLSREEVGGLSIGYATMALINAFNSALVLSERARKARDEYNLARAFSPKAERLRAEWLALQRASYAVLTILREKGWCSDD